MHLPEKNATLQIDAIRRLLLASIGFYWLPLASIRFYWLLASIGFSEFPEFSKLVPAFWIRESWSKP